MSIHHVDFLSFGYCWLGVTNDTWLVNIIVLKQFQRVSLGTLVETGGSFQTFYPLTFSYAGISYARQLSNSDPYPDLNATLTLTLTLALTRGHNTNPL